MYVYAPCAYMVPVEIRGGHLFLWDWNYGCLWVTLWVLEIESRYSARAKSVLNHWVLSWSPYCSFMFSWWLRNIGLNIFYVYWLIVEQLLHLTYLPLIGFFFGDLFSVYILDSNNLSDELASHFNGVVYGNCIDQATRWSFFLSGVLGRYYMDRAPALAQPLNTWYGEALYDQLDLRGSNWLLLQNGFGQERFE